ncbi:MAG: COP23 domain-containing protein [Nostoc sp. ChiSLP01]|nr:COP23 domain-containing protein [Nostoc sp. CmiSLP01]MDZ8287574.1 COP23 domain-containing protein [Nostoc sp. ChiSLP01]
MTIKLGFFPHTLGIVAIALGSTATLVQPGYTQSNKFFCGISMGVPATILRTSTGPIPVIRWVDDSFRPPWTPEQRCEEISARFERFYNDKKLNFIRTGKISNQPVLCVASYKGGPCLPNGVLVTLKVGTDAPLTLKRLFARQDNRVVNLQGVSGDSRPSRDSLFSYHQGAGYVDVGKLIGESCPVGKPLLECAKS